MMFCFDVNWELDGSSGFWTILGRNKSTPRSCLVAAGSWRLSVTTTDIPQHNISDSFGILRHFWILKDFVLCW